MSLIHKKLLLALKVIAIELKQILHYRAEFWISFQGYKLATFYARSIIYLLQMLTIVGLAWAIVGLPVDIQLSASNVTLFLVTATAGTFVLFLMGCCIEVLAFWADNV